MNFKKIFNYLIILTFVIGVRCYINFNCECNSAYAEPLEEDPSIVSLDPNGDTNSVNFDTEYDSHEVTDEYYIPNWNYFYSNPKHAPNTGEDNAIGTCTTVAMEMLIGYHNYYTDRRLIPRIGQDGKLYLNEKYGDLLHHPSISASNYYKLGGEYIGTEDTVFYGIFDSSDHAESLLGQTVMNITEGANKFLKSISPIYDQVSLNWEDFAESDAKNEIESGRPIILVFSPFLGSKVQFHVVVAYGYANVDGEFGFIVHFGWFHEDKYVWVPSSWLRYEVKMNIEHTHKFEDTDEYLNNIYKIYKCEECQYEYLEDCFSYDESENNNITIVGIKQEPIKIFTLPYSITRIYDSPHKTKVIENISIGANAFANCYDLRKIIFDKSSIYSIEKGAFKNCFNLTDVTLTKDCKVNDLCDEAFYACKGLERVTLSYNVKRIGNSTFEGCHNLKEFTYDYENKINIIGDYAFKDTGISTIDIPNSITNLGRGVVMNCSSLKRINFSTNNYINSTENADIFSSIGSKFSVYFNTNSIPSYIFYNNEDLQNVNIENFYKNDIVIEDYAFSHCVNLTYINIPSPTTKIGRNVFSYCERLADILLPSSVEYIGDYAFANSGIVSLNIPKNVKFMGNYLVNNCYNLETIIFNIPNYQDLGNSKIFSSIGNDGISVIFNDVINIPSFVFYDNTNITIVTIDSTVKKIGDRAFFGCKNLSSIIIPDSVEYIGEGAFCNSGVTKIQLSDNLTSIQAETFRDCINLTNIEIPNSVEYIGEGAFNNSGVTKIQLSDNLTSIQAETFKDCINLTNIEIPNSVEYIGEGAFSNSGLINLVLSDKILNVFDLAFEGCRNLANVTIENGLKYIGSYAFKDCRSLISITIPNSIENIGNYVFEGCYRLSKIIFDSQNCIDLSSNSMPFAEIDSRELEIYYNSQRVPNYLFQKANARIILSDNVNTIGEYAFYGSDMTSIYISSKVENISYGVFAGCNNLTEIIVANDNPIYKSVNNCLLLKSDNTLLMVCQTSVIPSYVKNIARTLQSTRIKIWLLLL